MRIRMLGLAGLMGALVLGLVFLVRGDGGEEESPGKIYKLLEMDVIKAIKEPTFVAGAEAEMPDDARVIAVEIGGESRVYDPNLLNNHEIVNDVVGGKNVAVAW